MPAVTTLTVTRTSLSLPTLNLNDPGVYAIRSFKRGRIRRRSTWVRASYVEGADLVGSVRDLVEMDLALDIEASTQATLQTRLDSLLDAFAQDSYTLTYGLDGTTYAWTCGPAEPDADIAQDIVIFGTVMPVGFIVPAQPVPTAGPY